MKGQSHLGSLSFSNPKDSGHGHFRSLRIFWGGQNANTLVTNRMPFNTYNLSVELRIFRGVMKGLCLFMSLSQ